MIRITAYHDVDPTNVRHHPVFYDTPSASSLELFHFLVVLLDYKPCHESLFPRACSKFSTAGTSTIRRRSCGIGSRHLHWLRYSQTEYDWCTQMVCGRLGSFIEIYLMLVDPFRLTYLNPVKYGFEALIANEFHGLEGKCSSLVPSGSGYENVTLANQVCTVRGSQPGSESVNGDRFIGLNYNYSYSNLWRNL